MIERRRQFRRAIPATIVVLALLPGIGTAVATLVHEAPPAPENRAVLARALVDPSVEPWGLVVDPEGVRPWSGPLPVGAERPDRAASPIPLGELQQSLTTQASKSLSSCYRLTRSGWPELEGDLVLHIAAQGRHIQMMLSGNAELRHAMRGCVDRALGEVQLPERAETSWLHFPLRFTPFVPVERRQAS